MGIAVQPAVPAFAVLLALSACFVDPGTATGASGMTTAGSTTAIDATSTGVTSTGQALTSSSSSSSSSPSSGSDPVGTDATTGAACVAGGGDCTGPGASCCDCLSCDNGTCAGPSTCTACQTCDSQGACVPAGEGTMCSPAVDPCSGRAWGAVNGECFAFAAAQGSCGPQGDCLPQQCEAQGALVFSCPQCVLDKHACLPGADLGSFDIGGFCHLNAETPNCGVECVDNVLGSEIQHKSCNSKGKCATLDSMNCGLYTCNGDQCNTSCMSAAQCTAFSKCTAGKCI